MLIIENLREVASLPILVKVGLVVMVFAGLSDVVAHLEGPGDGHLHAHTASEAAAHLAGLVGMVVIFLGVVLDGVRKSRAPRIVPGVAGKEPLDALR